MNAPATLPPPGTPAKAGAARYRYWGWALLVAAAWGVVAWWGDDLGAWLARRFPRVLAAVGAGKVPDAAAFASGRLRDAVALGALALGTVWGALGLLGKGLGRRHEPFGRVIWVAVALVVLGNAAAWLAGQRALFWLALQARGHENQAAFRAKERLLGEIRQRPRLAVVGSSQANTQFREESFNAALGGEAWMVDLHFPGSTVADVFFVTERFGPGEVEAFIYYASPLSFASRELTTARDLLRPSDLAELHRLGVWRELPGRVARYTALGLAMPLFQYRGPWINAFTGTPALPGGARGGERKPLQGGDFSEFQQRAFVRMLERVAAKGQRLVVIAGRYRPSLEARDDPAFRRQYAAFLETACARWPGVKLVWQDELLPQNEADYRDGTHVTEEAGERFTRRFVEKWKEWHAP